MRNEEIILRGRVGSIEAIQKCKNGNSVLRLSLGVNRYFKNEKGESAHKVEWHNNISIFGALADNTNDQIKVGSSLRISGQLGYNEWTSKEGVKHKSVSIIAKDIALIISDKASKQKENNA